MTAAPPTAIGGPPPTMPMDDAPPPTISVEDVPIMEGGPPAMIPVDVEPPPTTMPVKEISHIVKKKLSKGVCVHLHLFPPCFRRETIVVTFCLFTTKSSQSRVYS